VLDGRNRHRACEEIGIEAIARPWDGRGDPLSYVISKNLRRRHLNESQRAMVADKIANLKEGRPSSTAPIGAVSQSQAAKTMNVGRRSGIEKHLPARDHPIPRNVRTQPLSLTPAGTITTPTWRADSWQ